MQYQLAAPMLLVVGLTAVQLTASFGVIVADRRVKMEQQCAARDNQQGGFTAYILSC